MGFKENTLDLLTLLTAHVGGSSLAIAVPPHPQTPVATRIQPPDAADKKRKRSRGSKGSEEAEEGEVIKPLAKEAWIRKGQPKKSAHTGTSKEVRGDQPKKASIWRPIFTLSSGNPVLDDTNLRDPKKGSSGLVVAECLEKALCLPEDMAGLRSFRKCRSFSH